MITRPGSIASPFSAIPGGLRRACSAPLSVIATLTSRSLSLVTMQPSYSKTTSCFRRLRSLLASVESALRGREAALLYYRSVGTCEFTSREAIPLGSGLQLMHVTDPGRVSSAGAYVVTRAAAIALRDLILPVRAGPDSWGFFCEHGALDSLRCVVPRPVRVRNDFKSSLDYLPSGALRQRLSAVIAERRVFPFYELLAAKRRLRERGMSRFRVIP